jgi:uncharacterized cupin superfamily protein
VASVNLHDEPITETPYGRWQQLNEPLGVTGFGINAIICDPGEDFDISHSEEETGQQEAYIVVAGRAAFEIGDARIEAGPGTVVAAPEPAAVRSYAALEPGTRIVCVGASRSADPQAFGEWISEAAAE